MPTATETVTSLTTQLLEAQREDGGWGYRAAAASRLEPTCWSALALLGRDRGRAELDAAGVASFLARSQQANGLMTDGPDLPPNFALNGLVALVLAQHPDLLDANGTAKLMSALREAKGIQLPQSEAFRQDNSLQGWAWVDGTFSWLEPTAWCLLALKCAGDRTGASATRIDEAERVLFDRVCDSGGWNYGNAAVLGTPLHAYVPTTALGLLALQDRRDHTVVQESLGYLTRQRLAEPSGIALGLTILCLTVYGQATTDVEHLLHQQFAATGLLGNIATLGLALYALTTREHDVAALRAS